MDSGSAKKYLPYAIGEILLVMIGILLALQVNNWNESRKNRIQEEALLIEIHEEFKWNLLEFEENLNSYESVRKALRKIISAFPIDPQKIDLDTLARSLERIQYRGDYDASLTAIAKLKGTSSIDIISNEELRSLLIYWEVMLSDYRISENQAVQYHIEEFTPLMFKTLPRPYKDGLRDPRVDLNYIASLEFEGMIKHKLLLVNNLFRSIRSEPNILTVMKRIIELSAQENDK